MTQPASRPPNLLRIANAVLAGVRTWRVILVLLIVCIAVLALMPSPPPDLDTGWDKLNHLLAFTSLAFAASLSSPASHSARAWLLIALLGFGGLIEVFQLFVPGRSTEWADLLADAIGIACGAVIASVMLWLVSAQAMRRH